jgi:hypothetical protein
VRTLQVLLILGLVLGCGGKDGGLVDAGGPPDSDVGDAAPKGPVHVTTFSRCCVGVGAPGARVAGIEIIVTNPDGSIETAQTDANGEVTVELASGASVTAYYGDGGFERDMATFLGVEPGDELVYGKTFGVDEANIGAMTFDWPADANLFRVDVYHACGSNWGDGGAGTLDTLFYPSCAGALGDVVFVGRDINWAILRWGVVTGQSFVDGGTVSLPAWDEPGTLAMSVSGLPPEITNADLYATMMMNGHGTYNYAQVFGSPIGGEVSATVPWAAMGQALKVYARFDQLPFAQAHGAVLGEQHVFSTRAADVTEVIFADPITMPWMSDVLVSPETGELTWTLEGQGDWDATRLELFYSRNLGTEWMYYRWTVILPPGLDHATLPALPPALDAVVPVPGDGITVSGALFDLGDVAGYAEARRRPEWHFPERSWIDAVPDDLIKISGGPHYEYRSSYGNAGTSPTTLRR